MKLIENLGMQYATANSKTKRRFAIWECPMCLTHFKAKFHTESSHCLKCCQVVATSKKAKKGFSKTKIGRAYSNMVRRCTNPKSKDYKNYGGRGIGICDEWAEDFFVFKEWSDKNGYEENLTIDRINNDKGYAPDNCRWATAITQARNKRRIYSSNTSGYRGIVSNKGSKRIVATISVNNKRIYLGSYDYPWTAAYAYDSYVLRHDLEHTRNFSTDKDERCQ